MNEKWKILLTTICIMGVVILLVSLAGAKEATKFETEIDELIEIFCQREPYHFYDKEAKECFLGEPFGPLPTLADPNSS